MGGDREVSQKCDGDGAGAGDELIKPTGNMASNRMMEPFDICQGSLATSDGMEEETTFGNLVAGDGSQIIRPGMVLLKKFIPLDDQVKIVRICRRIALADGAFYQLGFTSGPKRSGRHIMCVGLDWDPQMKNYSETRHFDGARVPPVPDSFISLTERAIAAAHELINAELGGEGGSAVDILPRMHPNICIVNFYNTSGRLKLHQDMEESKESIEKGLPVVSVSLGESAMFLYGDERDVNKMDKVLLESGDVLIFGGSSRLIYHGVDSIIPHSAPAAFQQATNLRPGRLNLTFRQF